MLRVGVMLAIGIVISQGADLGAQLTEHREAAFVQQQDPKNEPQPEGGSEAEKRKPEATSNYLLKQQFPETIFLRGPANEMKIAVTFDDGPDPRFTPKILDVLKEEGAKGTFFVMGARAKGHPELVKRIVSEGHAIGNHTYWHPNLIEISSERRAQEISNTEKEIANITGVHTRLFRAPYGILNEEVVKQIAAMDNVIIGWSVDSLDWRQNPAAETTANVLGNIHPGAIVLFHDGGDWTMDLSGTVTSLRTVIQEMKAKGFEFVTVPELLSIKGTR